MIKTSTKNELVRYLYKESTRKENIEINQSKLTDQEVESELDSLESVQRQLDDFTIAPPKRVIDSILQYSRNCE